MSSRGGGGGGHHRRPAASAAARSRGSTTTTATTCHSTLSALKERIRSTKATERRPACRDLLVALQDPTTLRRLEVEAERSFESAASRESANRAAGSGAGGGGGVVALPWDRVCVLYRSVMDAALLSSRTAIYGGGSGSGGTSGGGGRAGRRAHANQTGRTASGKLKYNADDVTFPYQVFLAMDADQRLEVSDFGGGHHHHQGTNAGESGGNEGSNGDWKTRPRYAHHLNLDDALPAGPGGRRRGVRGGARPHHGSDATSGGTLRGTFDAAHRPTRTYTDRDRGSRLTSRELNACVEYCVECLNDEDCMSLPGVEATMLRWLGHVCVRPDYAVWLHSTRSRVSHVLHEASARIDGSFFAGEASRDGRLAATMLRDERRLSSSSSSLAREAASPECLLACAKCLSGLVCNSTTRLGMGMHLYVRPVVELVAAWAEDAWRMQTGGGFGFAHASTTTGKRQRDVDGGAAAAAAAATAARNPHRRMIEEGRMARVDAPPSSSAGGAATRRTEADVLALLPHLYSCVTHLLAAHPEQSVPVLSDHGHALLRFARRNYARPGGSASNVQARDALTEYVGAHLLVAEASGRLRGLPEGDLGPLVPRAREEEEADDDEGGGGEEGDGNGSDEDEAAKRRKKKKKKNKEEVRERKGATLDAKAIRKLLDMVRDERVWESLFSASASKGQSSILMKKKRAQRRSLGTLGGRSGGGAAASGPSDGGAAWTPLARRQRRHLEVAARLVRVAQRQFLSDAEDRDTGGDGGNAVDTLEALVERAEGRMQRSGIERGEIDIRERSRRRDSGTAGVGAVPVGDDPTNEDGRCLASPSALACSPWVCMVFRHLYKMNPKLGKLAATDRSFTQQDDGTVAFTTQQVPASSAMNEFLTKKQDVDDALRTEAILLESCPMLQALTVDESTLSMDASAAATMTQGTLTASALTAPASGDTADGKAPESLDSVRPTAVATLQFLCACAEAFPRGECWSSSARLGWSTVLDERSYPDGTSANVLERHGSSPADAAAVVYLLGTTLESQGGSGGDEEIQLWTLVALLKMTESSAIICSRGGLLPDAAASFGSASSMKALRVAWQHVWRLLVRYDLRYSSYTSGAHGSNIGEIVVQLLTQIIRCQCVDRMSMSLYQQPSPASLQPPFLSSERGQLWKLPVFENDGSSLFSPAPFELMTSAVQSVGYISDASGAAELSYCIRFIESSIKGDTTESKIRRTFLPFAATCLASLLSETVISPNASTFEMDGLTRFAVTEDVQPIFMYCSPDEGCSDQKSINHFQRVLWSESISLRDDLGDPDQGLALRIAQGRGAFLNQFIDAQYERDQLRFHLYNDSSPRADSGIFSPGRSSLGSLAYERIKLFFDEFLFQLKYEDGSASDDEEKDAASKGTFKASTLPRLTSSLSLMLTVIMSKNATIEEISLHVVDLFEGVFASSLDLVVENVKFLKGCPSDFLVVMSHLHGIVRVLTFVAAFGGGGTEGIPRLFCSRGKSLFSLCKSLLKEYRNEACASGAVAAVVSGSFDSDSDDERNSYQPSGPPDSRQQRRTMPNQQLQSRRSNPPSNFSDDSSDGLMDDDNDDDENSDDFPRKPKRRRIGNGAKSRAKTDVVINAVDARGAWMCASLMLVLNPSFRCLESICSHLVWPEDNNNQTGYATASRSPDPLGALVCAALFCQKSVLLRRDRLDLQSGRGQDEDEDQDSAIILSIEVILQARRSYPPASKHFMCGLGLVADIVKISDYGESCGPIGVDESKVIMEALNPEAIDKQSEDFFLMRQWKKILKPNASFRSQQLRASALSFLYAKSNLRKEFEGSIAPLLMGSFCHIDSDVRSQASEILGAALALFSDQRPIVSDVLKNALPRLDNERKFRKWVNALSNAKLEDDLVLLEERALFDAEYSIEYHAIQCLGLIAGSASDIRLSREMVWKLIDLAAEKPSVMLVCYRACKRASFLLGFKSLDDLIVSMTPYLLVKWLESQRSLHDFPLLLMSPFAVESVCHYLPNELLSMFLLGEGWNDSFFCLAELGGEAHTLNKKVLTPFVESVAEFLIPNILLSSSDDDPGMADDGNESRVDATKRLTECVLILTAVDNDENVAKVLCNHIADLYAFVAVLAENGDATDECENAFKHLKRCVSSAHIERAGAKGSMSILRHILILHQKGISIVGHEDIELNSSSFIKGIKYVANRLKTPASDNRKNASVLEQLGSSLTESIVIVKFWLSSSLTAKQREATWRTFSLLCHILAENIQLQKVESGELGFCLHSFSDIILDQENYDICPKVLESLKVVLRTLFMETTEASLVDGAISVLHKLTLALLQIHQRALQKLLNVAFEALSCIEYEQKLSQGLLGFESKSSVDSLGETPWEEFPSERDATLKNLIRGKAGLEENISSETMLGAYECLEIIAHSGKTRLEDILGAEDVIRQRSQKEEVACGVNEKYSMRTFFTSLQRAAIGSCRGECEHFLQVLNEHPIMPDDFDSSSSQSSHDILARQLALRRLEKVLLVPDSPIDALDEFFKGLYPVLLRICHSNDPEESRLISSRCIGELLNAPNIEQNLEVTLPGEVDKSLGDPIASIKKNILTMLGRYLLSECADTSLVAMKTAKALLVTPAVKECWGSLDGDTQGLLASINTVDDSKLRKEAVKISDTCLASLRGSEPPDSDSWCWSDNLWTCLDGEGNSCDVWIRNLASSIISCCFFGKKSRVGKGNQDFFRICQGMCAAEASFAASIFPALIFHLLDSEERDACPENSSVYDTIASNIAIGSPTSEMNKTISRCFSRILDPEPKLRVAPQAVNVILNTLELLRAITEYRFITSPEHVRNKATTQKQNSKKRRARNGDSADIDSLVPSPRWRGFPYGVVLRVSGVAVAKACLNVKRYYSALYYAEMSQQNLVGSSTFFEDIANDTPFQHDSGAVCDISGFGVLSRKEYDCILEEAMSVRDIIRQCLNELQANDDLHGLLSQGSALDLKRNVTSLNTLEGCRQDQPLTTLQDLDSGLQSAWTMRRANASDALSTIVGCLEDIGLNHVKHNYLAGVEKNLSREQMTDGNMCRYLREKWFEDSLNNTSQWDDSLFPIAKEDGLSEGTPHLDTFPEAHPPSASQPEANFYEAVHESLSSFVRNDVPGGLVHAMQARKAVLGEMGRLADSEAALSGMVTHLTKLNVLGQLEAVAAVLQGRSSLSVLLNRWGFDESIGAQSLQSLFMQNDVSTDVKDHVASIDGALFRSIRTSLSVKEVSLRILTNKSPIQEGVANVNALASHIYKSCSVFRELGYPDAAKYSVSSLRSLLGILQNSNMVNNSSGCLPLMLRMEDAKIMKRQKDLDGAITYSKLIASYLTTGNITADIERDQICVESLLLSGLWMAEHNVDSSESVLSSYFEKAAKLATETHRKSPSTSSLHWACLARFKLGEFAATLFNAVDVRMSSEAWTRRVADAQRRRTELEAVNAQLTKLQKKSRSSNESAANDARILSSTLRKEVEMDDRELRSVETSLQRYLHLAIESISQALKLCPTTTMSNVSKSVFQLVSLWFKNCQRGSTKEIVNGLLGSNLSQIPSYRFVPLTYQLFSRIDGMQDDNDDGFQTTLQEMVLKICSEHPYHGIPQLLALSNGHRVGRGLNGRHANAYLENIGTTKVDAVNCILKELRKRSGSSYVSGLIDSYQTLMISYMNLAEYETDDIVRKRITKRLAFKQYKLDLDSCLSGGGRGRGSKCTMNTTNMPVIITKPPSIRPDAHYGNGIEDPIGAERVARFESTFDLTDTGIHRPKIVKCIGSKGTTFKQLVKGEDDLRQDAIMQQVFETVNDLLRHEGFGGDEYIKKSVGSSLSTATTRQLKVITYGITPLSPASGVLEWVDNTMCFGDFLTDRGKKVGAHSKYYPGEWGNAEVRECYRNASDAPNSTPESKRKAFLKICENFSPAFRFFFLEYFKSSMEAWHTARSLYTRSCAVNSIVGHILGIGDRHTSNILVHTKTGEVVQIDFGIVFEQGKTLQTPETVPFRLTRDMVDGMGPSGTDGVFSKAAEAAMAVLRSNADTLLTILSAVVSDPLYKWSLSPLKLNQHQKNNDRDGERADTMTALVSSSSDENRNDAADRAIAKIHEKLEGYEDGTSGEHKTVPGQVKLLINEARDPGNLSVMYFGWAPWM